MMSIGFSSFVGLVIVVCVSTPGVLGDKRRLEGTSAIIKDRLVREANPKPKSPEKPPLVDPHSWNPKNCAKVSNMLVVKARVIKRMQRLTDQLETDEKLPEEERKFQKKSFEIFSKELVETEELILESINWLDRVLKGDYRNVIKLRESSKARLDALRDATLKEEQEYQDILKAWEQLQQYNQTNVEGLIDEILKDVAEAANQLQDQLDEHLFDNALHDAAMGNGPNNVEAVIRLGGGTGDTNSNSNSSKPERADDSVIKLVDSRDNQFVLAKGKDSTIPHEDHNLIQDVVYIMLASLVFGWLCSVFGLPTMFGYIISGVVLGPSGLNILKSLVQLETVGQFGVFFILFCVGLEFSPAKLRQVLKVACVGTTLMMAMMVLCGVALGYVWHASTNESIFVAACLSLSSTPLVVKFLNPGGEEGPSSTDYGNTLLGILIMQDVLLGLLMAVMPNMAPSDAPEHPEAISPYVTLSVNLIGALLFVIAVCFALAKWILGPFYKYLLKLNNKEVTLLATVGLAFLMLTLTNKLQISMELGCFLAGAVVSAQGHGLVEQIELIMNPVRDMFACIFFASIGLHVFPQFLAYQMTILTTLTMATIGAKYIISVCVLAVLSPKGAWHVKWIVSAGLAQVSEFSFVLGSQARRLGLISREVYLLILGITTMSLICAPALWQLTLWQLRVKSGAQLFPPKVTLPHVSPTTSLELGPQALPTPSIPEVAPRRRQLST